MFEQNKKTEENDNWFEELINDPEWIKFCEEYYDRVTNQ